jgi:hypothetical protein
MSPPYIGLKSQLSKKQHEAGSKQTDFLLGAEDGGDIFFHNVG